ncbi:MAG: DedA family protein [Alphaproteobacteria bacterium]|nr:DedA family protein [Alphaproteobacteria bacterium]MBV9372846.1 DedA family protein [Alphaproteobacteria bacterium]MBV9900459.1 DedA family protein [Alphaproteobacteria bacterium]
MWVETFFPIFPSELVMPLSGLIATQNGMSLAGVAVSGAAGAMTGSVTWYWAARALGAARFKRLVTRYGRITTVSMHEVEWLERWFHRLGPVLVLVGRVVPAVRTAISIPAGLVAMPFGRFLLLSAIGTLVSTGLLTWLGSLLGDHYEAIEHYAGPVSTGIVAAAFLLWLTRLVLQFVRRGR